MKLIETNWTVELKYIIIKGYNFLTYFRQCLSFLNDFNKIMLNILFHFWFKKKYWVQIWAGKELAVHYVNH